MFHKENPGGERPQLLAKIETLKDEFPTKKTGEVQSNLHLESAGESSSKLWYPSNRK